MSKDFVQILEVMRTLGDGRWHPVPLPVARRMSYLSGRRVDTAAGNWYAVWLVPQKGQPRVGTTCNLWQRLWYAVKADKLVALKAARCTSGKDAWRRAAALALRLDLRMPREPSEDRLQRDEMDQLVRLLQSEGRPPQG